MGKTILIAENTHVVRVVLLEICKPYGFTVYEAKDGKQAVDVAVRYQPDLIFINISLPVIDGLSTTKIIRNSGAKLSRIPIIAMTASGWHRWEEAIKAGCTEFLTKPFNLETIETILATYLSN